MSFELIVQQKVFAALNGNLSCEVYDTAPENSPYPFVTIGEAIANEWDTDNEIGQDVNYTINVWTREDSSKQAKTIQGEVYNILHLNRFLESGYHFTENYFLSSNIFKDTDSITRNGVQEFKLTIEKVN